jgi:ABC-type uncharacterized transport system involved in gliding motility auxiliary subunit
MPEILIILTVVFIAYLVYNTVGDAKKSKSNSTEAATPVAAAKTQATRAASTKPVAKKPSPTKPAETKSAATKPVAKVNQPEKSDTAKAEAVESSAVKELRNPETNEVSAVAANYRFLKRWIKEALVTEGLLDKVYKTNELDDSNAEKIKNALNKIKTLKKYQV